MSDKPVVGVDVSKHWLDLCCGGKSERIANTSEAIGAWLERIDPGLVALEPTGGWERVLLAALRERAIAFVRVHPNHLAAFRRSLGVAAKTDRIDAALILAFATDRRARQRVSPGTAEREGLRALAARRRQLVEALHAERCRLDVAALAGVRHSLEAIIAALRTSPQAIEAAITQTIAADPDLAELDRLLRTIFGVAPLVAATLIAELPELGLLSGKQIAALVGPPGRLGAAHPPERQEALAREHRPRPSRRAPRSVQCRSQRHRPPLAVPRLLQPPGEQKSPARQSGAGRRDAQNPGHRQRSCPRPSALACRRARSSNRSARQPARWPSLLRRDDDPPSQPARALKRRTHTLDANHDRFRAPPRACPRAARSADPWGGPGMTMLSVTLKLSHYSPD